MVPTHGANKIQEGQEISKIIIQPPGMVQYNQHDGGQQLGNYCPPQRLQKFLFLQKQMSRVLDSFSKVENCFLGSIQIIIGLIHISYGILSPIFFDSHYLTWVTYLLYPYCGGIMFIACGSLAVSAEKNLISLVKCIVGMSIASAVTALIGTVLYSVELSMNNWTNYIDTSLCILLLWFNLMEFCITVSISHFGCQLTNCKDGMETIFVPYPDNEGSMAPTKGNPAVPAYDNVTFSPEQE